MSLKAVVKKELIQIKRDTRTLMMLIVTPAMLLLLFGYILSFDVKDIKTGVLDFDSSSESQKFITSFMSGDYFTLEKRVIRRGDIDKFLDEGKLSIAIVIPEGFGNDITAGRNADLQIIIDGADGRKGSIIESYVTAAVQHYSQKIKADYMLRNKVKVVSAVNLKPRIWFNPELKSTLFLIAGLIVFILMITGVISTSLSVVKERETGTMEQLLVSPLSSSTVIIGKTIPYLFISLISTIIILSVGQIAFGIEIKGSMALLITSTTLFILSALAQGILISTLTSSQQMAFFIAALSSILPALLLSGFIFPISGMPRAIQWITVIIPARYFVDLLRGVLMRGADMQTGIYNLTVLAIFSFIMLSLSAIRLKKVKLV